MKRAFTLIELSIVLIIIGLLVGGVLAGQALIEQAKLQAQASQLQQYNTAYFTFRLKYDAIPGDMDDASDFWSGANDGNGDSNVTGTVDFVDGGAEYENLHFFQHLSEAGLTDAPFDGTFTIGTGYPRLAISEGQGMVAGGFIGAVLGSRLQLSDDEVTRAYKAMLALNISVPDASSGSGYNDRAGTLTPLQAFSLDTKLDDGAARTGIYKTHRALDATVDCLTATDGDYDLSLVEPNCMSLYIIEN